MRFATVKISKKASFSLKTMLSLSLSGTVTMKNSARSVCDSRGWWITASFVFVNFDNSRRFLFRFSFLFWLNITNEKQKSKSYQILAKRCADLRFALKANFNSRSSIKKTQNRVQTKHEYKPGSKSLEFYRSYTNTDWCSSYSPKFESYQKLNIYPFFATDVNKRAFINDVNIKFFISGPLSHKN